MIDNSLYSLRTFAFILLYFLQYSLFSQKTIKLTSPLSRRDDYHLVNPSDSTLIEIGHGEDMGVRYGQYYRLKDSLPSGKYYVIVDDSLREESSFKDSLKHGNWIRYYNNLKEITPYVKGKIHGYYKLIRANGSLEIIAKWAKGVMPIRTSFYENGKVKNREYFIWSVRGAERCRIEYFDENENLSKVDTILSPIKQDTIETGSLDSKHILRFKEGYFKLNFRTNKLISWKYFDSRGKELLSENNPTY